MHVVGLSPGDEVFRAAVALGAASVLDLPGASDWLVDTLAHVGERLQSELSDGLKHDEPRLSLANIQSSNETASDQSLESIDDIDTESAIRVGYPLNIVQGPPASEDAEAAEEGLEFRIQELVAPTDRVHQGSLSWRNVSPRLGEKRQILIQPREYLVWG